jgi:hypothetical protein
MDTSNFAISVVLSQLGEDNFFLVDFYSCKFSLVKINYDIHDKELITILDAFEKWCLLFEKIQHEITMYSNHENLQYFMTTCVLNQLQA